jgi:hypothetical protein
VQIPGLGPVSEDADLGWYHSAPLAVPVLGSAPCRVVLDGYADDARQEDFHEAIRTFLTLDPSALTAAAPSIFAYYRDVMNDLLAHGEDDLYIDIEGPHDVLNHVRPGDEAIVSRDAHGDRHVYVSLECECDWEPEHGLQIVFRDGHTVTKVGPYDGNLTNAAAYPTAELDGAVYYRPG